MPLHLITDILDAYEATEAARLALATRYDIALDNGDKLGLRRVEALIAAHDIQHGTQLLDELTGLNQTAAA